MKLAHNIIGAVRELKLSVEQKSVLYMMIAEILTNSNLPENVDFIKKFVKSIANLLNKVRNRVFRVTMHIVVIFLLLLQLEPNSLLHRKLK